VSPAAVTYQQIVVAHLFDRGGHTVYLVIYAFGATPTRFLRDTRSSGLFRQ
jgi:hypothetical protein